MLTEEMRERDERWELASWAANEGIWDWNLRTNKVYRSDRWFMMFGYAPGEVADTPWVWESMIHPDDASRVIEQRRDHIEGKAERYYVEHRMRCKDGQYRWFLSRGQVIRDEEGKPIRMLGFYTNIQETIESRARILRQNAALKALYDVSLQAIGDATHDATLTAILKQIREFVQADMGYLSILDPNEDLMRTHSLSGALGPTVRQHRRGEHLIGLVWETGTVQYIPDFNKWPGRPPTEDANKTLSAVGLPLFAGQTIVGAICFGFTSRREILAEEIDILRQFAVIAALVVRNRQMAMQLQEDFRLRTLLEKAQPADRLSFLGELVEGSLMPSRDFSAQAKLFGLPLKSGYLTLVADLADAADRYPNGLMRVEGKNGMNLWLREQRLHVLLPLALPKQERPVLSTLASELCGQLESLLGHPLQGVGVGLHCASLREATDGFRQAKEALELGSLLHPKRAVHHYLDIGLLKVLMQTGDKAQIEVYISHMLGSLIAHDREKNSHLMETLAAILGAASLRSAADELYVHSKTLLFRKRHIEELIGESLDDPTVRLNLTLAMQLHTLLSFR